MDRAAAPSGPVVNRRRQAPAGSAARRVCGQLGRAGGHGKSLEGKPAASAVSGPGLRRPLKKCRRISRAYPPHEAGFVGAPCLRSSRAYCTNTRAPVFPTPRNPRVSRGARVGGPGAFGPPPGTRPVRAGWRPPISRRYSSTASSVSKRSEDRSTLGRSEERARPPGSGRSRRVWPGHSTRGF